MSVRAAFLVSSSIVVACGAGPSSSGAPCVPAICGHTYECFALDSNDNPVGQPFVVTLSPNAQGMCVSMVGGAQGDAVYECDGSVTYDGSTVSTWKATSDGYTVCASGCNRCTLQ